MSSIYRLKDRLRTNRLLAETNHDILNKSLNGIVEGLGGIKAVLFELTKSLKLEQLNILYNTILKEQRKANNMNVDNDHEEDDTESMDETTTNPVFSWLPHECISYICGFLNKSKIKVLKATSRTIGIVCLEEMQKTSIGIVSIHSPFNNNQNQNNSVQINDTMNLYHLERFINTNRYFTTKRYYSLFEDWELKYGIHPQNQLVFQFYRVPYTFTLMDLQQIRLHQIPQKSSKYVIVDKRNVIIWNDNKPKLFDEANDGYSKDYKVMILEYFDVFEQRSNIAQIILYRTNQMSYQLLLQYIENKFILVQNIDNEWYHTFKLHLTKMNHQQNESKIAIYACQNSNWVTQRISRVSEENISHYSVFTFQLNKNSDYPNANQFNANVYDASLDCGNSMTRLMQCIDHYNSTLNEGQKQLDIEHIKKANKTVFKLSFYSFISRLKSKISQDVFNGVIHPKYIAITNKDARNGIIKSSIIRYNINLYDIHKMNDDYYTQYIIRIFPPSQCLYPYFHGDKDGILFNIKYKNDFIIKDFIHYIFETIKHGQDNGFLYQQFKDLVPLLDNEQNYILCPKIRSNKLKFVYITPYHYDERYVRCAERPEFDLFFMNHKAPNQNQDKIELKIKFVSNVAVPDPVIPSVSSSHPAPFTQSEYISTDELSDLQIGDHIYHRDYIGNWCYVEIIDKDTDKTRLKIHYIGYNPRYDVWCNITTDCYRFCRINPYSTISVQNVNGYQAGDNIFVNPVIPHRPLLRNRNRDSFQWIQGRIVRIRNGTASVKLNQQFASYTYKTHVDNGNEIRKYKPDINLPSNFHRYEMIKHRDNSNGITINKKFKRFIGLPLSIFIDKNDKLEDIINKYLIYSKDYIMTIYRVTQNGNEEKVMAIPKNKRKSYKPYHEFIKDFANDFVVIKLKKCNKKSVYAPIYPTNVIGGNGLICSNQAEMGDIIKLLFNDKYCKNNLSAKISKRLMEMYDEANFEWYDIVDDINVNGGCCSIEFIAQIFNENDIDITNGSNETFIRNLLKRCQPINIENQE